MKEKKRVENRFKWAPASERAGNHFGEMGDERTPVFRVELDDKELYFVNESDETLKRVVSGVGGSVSFDGGAAAVTGSDLAYDDVKPGEAVLIDRFCPVMDSDYLLQASVEVFSEKLGELYFSTYPEKGEVPSAVLLWDTGEKGKNVMGHSKDSNPTKE